jgi:quercetin dioxygenase-like cupin family protein
MRGAHITRLVAIAGAGGLLLSCSDRDKTPTGLDHAGQHLTPHADVIATQPEPFTVRASIDPYKIQQLPDFMMQSRTRTDIVMQRSVFVTGPGPWHIHPGPSFVYVIQGRIKLGQFSDKEGCTETPVRGPGEVYFEEGNRVHRAVVVSSESAVVLVTRFNIPVGQPFTIMVPDPGC